VTFVQESVKTVLAYLGGFGGVSVLLYFTLKKALERSIDVHFDKRLARVRHDFELEQQRMSVVYQNQKDSFKNVLLAMHNAIEAIEREVDGDGDWGPISQKPLDNFSRVMSEEGLFMNEASDRALRLFREAMWRAVQYKDEIPTGDQVWQAYNQMNFIVKRLGQHFRIRVGLSPDVPDPLFDVEILGACRLINGYHFPAHQLPTKSVLKFDGNQDAAHHVASAHRNIEVLKTELERVISATKDDAAFFEVLTQAKRYLDEINRHE
jgi:hypothetical protein